jgi:hypothetical protein
MNKMTFVLMMVTSLVLGLAAPQARASASATDHSIQTLTTGQMSADVFNSLFTPYNTAILSPFAFSGSTGNSGMIESQVFQGKGAASGFYAYAYQLAVNNSTDASGNPVHVDSTSYNFGATPIGTDLTSSGSTNYAYVIPNGQVGGLNLSGTQAPTSLSWQPQTTSGIIRAQYVDPTSQTQPLGAGGNSATFVLVTNQLPSTQPPTVNVGGAAATTTVPVAYAASGGTISPIPIPEPSTILAWTGMAGAVGLVRRFRKARAASPA